MYEWIIQNKEPLKIFYALAVALICTIIVLKTDRLFRLSLHQGIRYFRNAFLFYGLSFLIRYFVAIPSLKFPAFLSTIAFEYLLIMAGFFLLYSLLWKNFGSPKPALSSLFNPRILMFYLMALVIVVFDYLWVTHKFMFLSQIVLFAFATAISYSNYKKKSEKGKFLKFYFVAMLLSFLAWTLNFLAASIFSGNQFIMMNIYGLNLIIFLLFLFGVIKFTSKNGS